MKKDEIIPANIAESTTNDVMLVERLKSKDFRHCSILARYEVDPP